MSEKISYSQYLEAKKTVDDRALHPRILTEFCRQMALRNNATLLELGAGVGTMLERLWENDLRFKCYTLVDELKANRETAIVRLTSFFQKRALKVIHTDNGLIVDDNDSKREIRFVVADCFEFLEQNADRFDGLVASALLDLLPLDKAIVAFVGSLKPKGYYYIPINFDGETIFEPTLNRSREEQLMDLYHQTMDTRRIAGNLSGDSRTGRKLFAGLVKQGISILDAAASDWVVFGKSGSYPAAEDRFLRFIVETVWLALHKDETAIVAGLEDWYRLRLSQLDAGELVYIAHQIDFLGQRG